MRLPSVRFTIRGMMIAVAVIGLCFGLSPNGCFTGSRTPFTRIDTVSKISYTSASA